MRYNEVIKLRAMKENLLFIENKIKKLKFKGDEYKLLDLKNNASNLRKKVKIGLLY